MHLYLICSMFPLMPKLTLLYALETLFAILLQPKDAQHLRKGDFQLPAPGEDCHHTKT